MLDISSLFDWHHAEEALRLGCAAFLGLLLGLDREVKHKPIGMRSYVLVSVGAAAASLVVGQLPTSPAFGETEVSVDPSRVIQGIVGGIGFLGAGAIIQSQRDIRGAATGAGIWVVGIIGIACGFGLYWYAILTATLSLAVLTILGFFRSEAMNTKDDQQK